MIVFGEQKDEVQGASFETKSLIGSSLEGIEVELDKFIDYFKAFKIKTIELSVSGAFESGGILKLFASSEAKAVATITLEPK